MRTLKLFFAAFLSLIVLVACNESANNASSDSELNIDEILDKSIQSMSELSSYSMDMNLIQDLVIPGEEAPVKISGTIKTDITMEPISLYQTMSLSSDMDDLTYDTENYITDDGFYMSNPEDGSWMKFPSEFAEQMKETQTDADEQLQLLKSFSEEITISEEDNEYVLTIKGSGEKFMDLTRELLQQMGDSLAEDADLLSMMDMKVLDFVVHIDKETFYQTKIELDLELEMTEEGETMTMKQNINGTMSNFNGIDAIVIPEDVKNNAEEFAF